MAFMTPHYIHDSKWLFTKPDGESELFDESRHIADYFHANRREALDGGEYTISAETGWWCRLSANGYMDCTDWSGPFETEEEARKEIEETYEVDPDTGDDLPES